MKCSKCGFKARDINGMRKHYLKKHPGAMKRGRRIRQSLPVGSKQRSQAYQAWGGGVEGHKYCPTCGRPL